MTVAESYAHCEAVARREAKNFYYSFLLLAAPERLAMCAIYAFMRYCDDLSDDETVTDRAAAIGRWKADLESPSLVGLKNTPEHPLWPAFIDAVARYKILRTNTSFQMIEGVWSSDLQTSAHRDLRTTL